MESPKSKRKGKKRMPAAAVATKRVIVEFPAPLYIETEQALRELEINRSELIRSAVAQYLDHFKRQKLERELAEGYAANAAFDRQICAEFSYIDSENF